MTDLSHSMGIDFSLSANGDLITADGSTEVQQRVLRRLLTNPGAYIWQLGYGAGLPAFIGQANPFARIRAVTRQQMKREDGVLQNPPPNVDVTTDATGLTNVHIQYVDAQSSGNVTLDVPL